jgi:hypothetical protein
MPVSFGVSRTSLLPAFFSRPKPRGAHAGHRHVRRKVTEGDGNGERSENNNLRGRTA